MLAGCGKEATPVTAATSKFQAGGEDEQPGATVSGEASPASSVATATPDGGSAENSGTSADAPPAGRPPTAVPNAGKAAQGSKAGLPAIPAEGNVAELKQYIIDLGSRELPGRTQQEKVAAVFQVVDLQVAAVNKILDAEPSAEDKTWAVSAAMDILGAMEQSGLPGVRPKIEAFAKGLTQRTDPALARQGRSMLYSIAVIELIGKSPDDGSPVVARTEKYLADEKDSLDAATLAQVGQTALVLNSAGLRKDAIAVFNATADAATASKDEKVAAQQHAFRDQAVILEHDLGTLGRDLLQGEKEADVKLVAAIKAVLGKIQPTAEAARQVQNFCGLLDVMGHSAGALECLTELETLFKKSTDKELTEQVQKTIDNARQRASLVGKEFSVEGLTLQGEPFDWAAYKGKVVLVDFWATWCEPCIQELPNVLRQYEDFRDAGFDVVGVNLDTEPGRLKQFFDTQELPWTTVISQEVRDEKVDQTDPAAFTKLPMAVKCGVDSIPFLVLVGKDGKVDSLHLRGERLRTRLVELLGDPENQPAATPPTEKPAEKPAEEPTDKKPAVERPAEEKQSAITPLGIALAAALLAADDQALNPYSAQPGLTTEQLSAYILKMLDKPKSIQARPGFCAAVCEACDRLMGANPPATQAEFFVAAEAKFEALHKQACTGDAEADQQLAAFVAKMKADERPRIARQVAFFEQERKVLDAIEGPMESVPEVLKELQEYYAQEKLGPKHLRMASSTVALINRLEDGDAREKHFGEFGKTFATSSDKELARYGKKLAKKPAATESDLVGQSLELSGTTASGGAFAWETYRGKVVLVDFWATWCGPCRREMPNVKALHEKLRERGFAVVGVSLDEDQEALAAYLEENAIAWETLAGEGTQQLAEKYGVRGIPTMMLIDKEGKIAGVAHNVAALAPIAEKLLGGPAN
jgi:thiol-disulfide isomerase/thioredoxin